jgi:transposase
MGHSSLITGPERRRRWSDQDKQTILMEAFAPGAIVVEVARRYEISTSLIYKWRHDVLGITDAPAFSPAVLIGDGSASSVQRSTPAITLDLIGVGQISISAAAPPALVAATLKALR